MRQPVNVSAPSIASVGQSVQVLLPDGQVLVGTVTRSDARTLRVRPTGGSGLIVLSRPAVTVVSATGDLAA